MKKHRKLVINTIPALLFLSPFYLAAQVTKPLAACIVEHAINGDQNLTIAQVRAQCEQQYKSVSQMPSDSDNNEHSETKLGLISQRIIKEQTTQFEPWVLTPHYMNYILPLLVTDSINKDPYQYLGEDVNNLEDVEAKFQLSLKVPLNYDTLLIDGDGLFLGFTVEAWWQVYADNISKPFRETNYRPELFYLTPLDWYPFNGNTGLMIGIEHQSNGRNQLLSRSWNRVYVNFLYEKNNFALSFKPWYRLKEDPDQFEGDPDGDDNPDILDYMGHFELGMIYKWHDYEFNYQGRHNFSTSKGSNELGVTFPLWGNLRGYAMLFSGYGESMIDYNYQQTRFGIGITLNNLL